MDKPFGRIELPDNEWIRRFFILKMLRPYNTRPNHQTSASTKHIRAFSCSVMSYYDPMKPRLIRFREIDWKWLCAFPIEKQAIRMIANPPFRAPDLPREFP